MTRDEIDAALERILKESAAIAKNPLAGEARVLGAGVALLVVIVAEQETRLRLLESDLP